MHNARTSDRESIQLGEIDEWMGFKRHNFCLQKRAACLIKPEKPLPGNPWIWRARFLGAFPAVDLELLRRGFHLAHVDVTHCYGAPRLIFPPWNTLYAYLVTEWKLAKKVVLEGFSRGGLPIYNWAAEYPDRVACIYADAPVCDIRSWPGGKGKGNGSPEDWKRCLAAYQLREDQVSDFKANPSDLLTPIVKANIPIIHVCGDVDESVPIEENTIILKKRLEQLGGTMKLIVKPGVGHHPHSLDPPDEIVNFIMQHASCTSGIRSRERMDTGSLR